MLSLFPSFQCSALQLQRLPLPVTNQQTDVRLKCHSVRSRDFNFHLGQKAIVIINNDNNVQLVISGRSDGQPMSKDALYVTVAIQGQNMKILKSKKKRKKTKQTPEHFDLLV